METPFDVNFRVYARRLGLGEYYALTDEKKKKLMSVLVQCGYSSDENVLSRSPTFGAVAYVKSRQDKFSHGHGVMIAYIASSMLYKINNESKTVELAAIESSSSFTQLHSVDIARITRYATDLVNLMFEERGREYATPNIHNAVKRNITNDTDWD